MSVRRGGERTPGEESVLSFAKTEMYRLGLSKRRIVVDFRFDRPIRHAAGSADPFAVDHDRRAAELARGDSRFASILILIAPLKGDLVWEAQKNSHIPEIVEELREETRFEYDETSDEERELSPAAFRKAWEKRRLETFLPP